MGTFSTVDAYSLSGIENINFPSPKTNISASERLDGARIATATFLIITTDSLEENEVVYLPIVEIIQRKGEEQNREEGEMAQKKLGGGRNRGKK